MDPKNTTQHEEYREYTESVQVTTANTGTGLQIGTGRIPFVPRSVIVQNASGVQLQLAASRDGGRQILIPPNATCTVRWLSLTENTWVLQSSSVVAATATVELLFSSERLQPGCYTQTATAGNQLYDGSNTAVGTAAGKAIGSTTPASCQIINIQADPANTDNVLVGNSTSQSHVLTAGADISYPVDNTGLIYVRSASGTQTVNWQAV